MDEDKYTDKQVCDILGDNHFSNLLQYVLHMFGTMPRSMTEEEIIQYLKMNKKIGIVFKFMPEEVKDWCRKYSKKLYWYDTDTLVDCWSNGGFEKRLDGDKVYTLSEDFQIKKEQKGEWIEFEIDCDGDFNLKDDGTESTKDEARDFGFHWLDVGEFLKCSINEKWHYTTFGGWQYADSKRWYLAPAVKLHDDLWNSYVIEENGDATPVIPVKIRFWKEYK